MNFENIKAEIKKQYRDNWDLNVGVFFHNSNVTGLDLDSFNFKLDNKAKMIEGLYTHNGSNSPEYYTRYGKNTYAIVVLEDTKVIVRSIDPMNLCGNSMKTETFVDVRGVEEVREL